MDLALVRAPNGSLSNDVGCLIRHHSTFGDLPFSRRPCLPVFAPATVRRWSISSRRREAFRAINRFIAEGEQGRYLSVLATLGATRSEEFNSWGFPSVGLAGRQCTAVLT